MEGTCNFTHKMPTYRPHRHFNKSQPRLAKHTISQNSDDNDELLKTAIKHFLEQNM